MSKRMRITLSNSFHGTSVVVLADPEMAGNPAGVRAELRERAWNGDKAAAARLRRIERTLCPYSDCTCGVER